MSGTILFFGPEDADVGFLSNFYEAPIQYRGASYATNEHFFQAQKAMVAAQAEAIRRAATPLKAKRLGRGCEMRPDWDVMRLAFMYMGLLLKFTQHDDLAARLMQTTGSKLVENNPRDAYWGVNHGRGLNRFNFITL